MKRNYTNSFFRTLVLSAILYVTSVNVHAQYCVPANINDYNNNYISDVNLGDLSNSTSGTTGSYTHFTSVSTTDIIVGETLTGNISITLNGWNTNNNRIYIWMNFNASNDSDFEDNGERFTFTVRHPTSTPGMKTIEVPISIPVPASAQLGASRMRIGFRQTTAQGQGFSSCNYSWVSGEVEDYNINFTDGAPEWADTDADGISDDIDVDDDNDGILDTIENACSENILVNGGFDNATGLNLGNNLNSAANLVKMHPWSNVVPGRDAPLNLIRVDGSGPHNYWGNPQSDARGGAGIYFDVNASSGRIYQTFTIANKTTIEYSCYFSARDNRTNVGDGFLRIRNGNDVSGNIISSIDDIVAPNSSEWTRVSKVVSLQPGTYTIEVVVENHQNIDEVSVIDVYSCDFDGDGVPNGLDLDSDNDGIPDNIEAQQTANYTAPSNTVNTSGTFIGLWDNYATGIDPQNTDGSDQADFLDLDSDNDGTPDIQENGMVNSISGTDTDLDGLDDNFEGSNLNDPYDYNDEINNPNDLSILPDTDGDLNMDGDLDYRDLFNINPPPSATIDFDGINDYIDSPLNLTGFNQLTTMVWVKLDPSFSSDAVILNQGGFEIIVNEAGRVRVELNNVVMNFPNSNRLKLNEWTHISLVFNKDAATDQLKGYINGKLVASLTHNSLSSPITYGSDLFTIGKKSTSNTNYFKGEIDEVRIFDQALTQDQLRKVLYQEIKEDSSNVSGAAVSKIVLDSETSTGISWSALKGYYPMTNIVSSSTLDFSENNNAAKLHHIGTVLEQTSPMPFQTSSDGSFSDASSWLHGDIWNISELTDSGYAIVKINNDIEINTNLKTLGLIIGSGKTLTMNGSHELNNTWYLGLNGTIDLKEDSQLVQGIHSDLVASASGKILRRQEGVSNQYWYNYWGSPVGSLEATTSLNNNSSTNNMNNSTFNLGMIKNGNNSNFEFTNQYHALGKISTRWLYTFKNGVTYYDYEALNPATPIQPGVGYTQKGTGTTDSEQQYIFEGKPNNGTIAINVIDAGGEGSVSGVSRTDYLVGNPYASAIDLHKFIDENEGVISGTIQLWQQWDGASHALDEYDGGYAQVTKLGSTRAYQFVGIQGEETGAQNGTKLASRYLPVAQGFMVEVIGDGQVVFKNSQRVFVKESDANGSYNNGSVFFRAANGASTNEEPLAQETIDEDEPLMQKLRLEFNSVDGPTTRRELLLGFSDFTTDGFDYGYDSKNMDEFNDDLNLILDSQKMLIQAYGTITQDKSVPLHLTTSGSYNYTIELTEIENFDDTQQVFLKDNFTGGYFDLKSNQTYEFASEAGDFINRFEVVFQNESESLSQVEVTLEELNLYYSSGRNKIVVLNPNNIEIKSVELFNISGQSVYQTSDIYQSTYNEFQLGNLSSGNYVVQLLTEGNSKMAKKIIIN